MSGKLWVVAVLASTALGLNAAAQTSASSQTSASGSSNASVSANSSGAQVNSSTSANASQNASVSHDQQNGKSKSKQHAGVGASGSASNSASAGAGNVAGDLASGTTINAVLSKSLDARKAKVGDQVVAKVSEDVKANGQVVLHKGSRLVGHVTEVQAREKGQAQSSLGIAFDQAVGKNGQQMPVHAVIQAMAAAQNTLAANAGDSGAEVSSMGGGMVSGTAHSGGGLLGGVGSTVGATAGAATSTVGSVGQTAGGVVNTSLGAAGSAAGNLGSAVNASGQLTSAASGVVGLQGLTLVSQAANSTQGSVITSTSRNVKLDSGTQMLLRVTSQ